MGGCVYIHEKTFVDKKSDQSYLRLLMKSIIFPPDSTEVRMRQLVKYPRRFHSKVKFYKNSLYGRFSGGKK